MNKLLSSLAVLAILVPLAACQAPLFNRTNPVNAQASRLRAADASSRSHHPDFIRKLRNPAAYRFHRDAAVSSICGKNDLQNVNSYDGSLGQPVDFVVKHKGAVAALAEGSPQNSDKFCSGTMISEDLFLTASHCVDSEIVGKWAVFNYEVKGARELLPQDHFKVEAIVEEGFNGKPSLDYAILKIEGKPGLKYGFTPVRATLPEEGHLMTIIQHPQGGPKMIESGPMAGEEGNYMLYADLDTEPGSSGSGVMDAEGFVVGVHTNGGCTGQGGANRGVKMTDIAQSSATIKQLLSGRRR